MEGKRIGIVVGGAGAIPEAYLIYMDVVTADWNEKRDDTKKPASNLCDTIENIRATLKPNLKEALKHDKEEE